MKDLIPIPTTHVEAIPDGGYFRKVTGTYVYKRLSDSGAGFLGLDLDYVYGVHRNGNVTRILRKAQVVEMIAWSGYREAHYGH